MTWFFRSHTQESCTRPGRKSSSMYVCPQEAQNHNKSRSCTKAPADACRTNGKDDGHVREPGLLRTAPLPLTLRRLAPLNVGRHALVFLLLSQQKESISSFRVSTLFLLSVKAKHTDTVAVARRSNQRLVWGAGGGQSRVRHGNVACVHTKCSHSCRRTYLLDARGGSVLVQIPTQSSAACSARHARHRHLFSSKEEGRNRSRHGSSAPVSGRCLSFCAKASGCKSKQANHHHHLSPPPSPPCSSRLT